ncbi:hypothetical protein Lalb_Chr07g0186861 [Lupinus albus]|uniref:Uncharacterized protein n=1 Tax=Lupinus albus TaxID=3870 RepID=A0A6A4Q9Y1_LUPAL|nr:hypothetical protein Lalb_Chr07g0186861 [Lupinus albus]
MTSSFSSLFSPSSSFLIPLPIPSTATFSIHLFHFLVPIPISFHFFLNFFLTCILCFYSHTFRFLLHITFYLRTFLKKNGVRLLYYFFRGRFM